MTFGEFVGDFYFVDHGAHLYVDVTAVNGVAIAADSENRDMYIFL